MRHHLRLEEELLTAVALANLDHYRVLNLRRQFNLKWELIHAVVDFPIFSEVRQRVLDVEGGLG